MASVSSSVLDHFVTLSILADVCSATSEEMASARSAMRSAAACTPAMIDREQIEQIYGWLNALWQHVHKE